MPIPVSKTYKLFINGQFPRTESGQYFVVRNAKGAVIANMCLASRKDLKHAVVAARGALAGWNSKSAYNRSQILYRMAEMLDARKTEFLEGLKLQGMRAGEAQADVQLGVDLLIYYAGWCDKYQQIFSTVNPVSSPHYSFSMPEATGVVCGAPADHGISGLIGILAPALAGGNTCVLLASETFPVSAVTFAEVLAVSDLPAGVVNILTGRRSALLDHFASHMDVNALVYAAGDATESAEAQKLCAVNVKRFFDWSGKWQDAGPYHIFDLQEVKTTWHPVEQPVAGGAGY